MKKKRTKNSRKTTARSRITSMACQKPPVNSVECSDVPSSSVNDELKLTRKDLYLLLQNARITARENTTLRMHEQATYEAERKKWLDNSNKLKLDAKVNIIRASSQMIEALARMIGGDGF